jgi:hypothetical protein
MTEEREERGQGQQVEEGHVEEGQQWVQVVQGRAEERV